MSNKKILVVDDEPSIRDIISMILSKEGYKIFTACNGAEAIEVFNKEKEFSVIMLDIIMPEMDGVETAKIIRKSSDVPILFLTAKSTDNDKVEAYGAGADDYLQKPFSRVELLLRIKALIKRCGNENDNEITFSNDGRSITVGNREVQLTNKEYSLLKYFYDNKGQVFDIEQLYEHVWNEKYMKSSSNTVMVYILNLRKKIEEDYTKPKLIVTVWGKGYCYAKK